MKISQRDAENICIAMLQWRTMDGKLTTWGHDIQTEIVSSLTTLGRVTLELDHAPQVRQVQKDGLGKYLGTGARPSPREDGQEVRREEGPEDRRSDSPGQGAQERREERKIVYIAGPMTGYPEHNFPAFHSAAAYLRSRGCAVMNPAEINTVADGRSKREIVQRDLHALLLCNTIYMLEGWECSTGARAEHTVALWAQMDVLFEAPL